MTENLVDKTVSHYRILAKIGAGGMGVVYKARDTRLNRLVALKFLPREDFRGDSDAARFELEAQAAARLDHPNIGAVYEIDSYEGQKFIAMAYLEGKTLGQRIDAGVLSLDRALDFAIQIAAGLEAAHSKDIIHRDIKADNIIITGRDQVKITDFGLAKHLGGPRVTQTGVAAGTVDYMSPEQGRARRCRRSQRYLGPRRSALRDGHRRAAVPGRQRTGRSLCHLQ